MSAKDAKKLQEALDAMDKATDDKQASAAASAALDAAKDAQGMSVKQRKAFIAATRRKH